MLQYNPRNERLKMRYAEDLKRYDGRQDSTIDPKLRAIKRYEEATGFDDLVNFEYDLALKFVDAVGKMSTTCQTKLTTVNHVKAFFEYMALEGLLKKKHARKAIKAIRLSEKDRRSAQGRKPVKFHTIAQYKDAVAAMPMGTPSERRDRALMAFLPVSGARDGAIISLNVEHVDFEQSLIVQDPNIVKTKAGKWIITTFFPVGDELIGEVKDYIDYLKTDLHTTDTDPLFPSTARAYDENDRFCSGGNLTKEKWSNAQPVREIVRAAFAAINLPYVKPHSIRHTLGRLSYDLGLEQEEVRAWSQNYGHENISTTYDNYGPISQDRKHTKILGLHNKKPKSQMATNPPDTVGLKELLREVLREELGSP